MQATNFTFNPTGKFRYTLDDKPMPGVTSILDTVLAKPALIQWAANMAVDHTKSWIETYPNPIKSDNIAEIFLPKSELLQTLEDARTAHTSKKEAAADVGKIAHAEVEKWIKSGAHYADFKHEDKKVEKMVKKFMKWAIENSVKFIDSEVSVYSGMFWYAGTFDFTCEINGKLYIGDFKTSSGIYYPYILQCAAYETARREMGMQPADSAVIVRCGKNGDFEVQERHAYDQDREAWLACLQLYKAIKVYQ